MCVYKQESDVLLSYEHSADGHSLSKLDDFHHLS
jgi:hypothetical protein